MLCTIALPVCSRKLNLVGYMGGGMKEEHGRRNDGGHIPINVYGKGVGNISLIKARSYLLGYRFIIQYDMIYVA